MKGGGSTSVCLFVFLLFFFLSYNHHFICRLCVLFLATSSTICTEGSQSGRIRDELVKQPQMTLERTTVNLPLRRSAPIAHPFTI